MTDQFSPLPNAHSELEQQDDWRVIAPVPDNVRSPPFPKRRGKEPSRVATYKDGDGRLLGYVLRYDGERGTKEFLPLTYCENTNKAVRAWRCKSWPPPRPLYGLDRLARHPHAAVVVCEGEKAADAAGELLPDHVTITSPNGAQSAKKADWSALRGRDVVIWPDADNAGRNYAQDVARLLSGVAATVRVAEPVLVALGWDAADALAEGWDQVRSAAFIATASLVERTTATNDTSRDSLGEQSPRWAGRDDDNHISPEATNSLLREFQLRSDGLYWVPHDPNKNAVWVCGPIEAVARIRNEDSESWGVLLKWTDGDGRSHEWAMPWAMLAGDGVTIREYLLDRGLRIAPSRAAREALMNFLSAVSPAELARCVACVGWHPSGTGRVFVLPDGIYGNTNGERVLLQSAGAVVHAFNQAGSLLDWQEAIGRRCIGNTRLQLAVSAAFAPPLLDLVGEESGGINFQGGSRIGKSTILRIAGSVWGGGPQGYVRQWRSTSNGLEGIAAAHCDALLALDELGQMSPHEAGDVAYMLANGAGKSRAGRDGGARRALHWRTFILSTGETSLADIVQEAGHRAKAGQEVRLVDLPADAGRGLGVFDEMRGELNAEGFARALGKASSRYYGTPIRAFLTAFASELNSGSDSLTDWVHERRRTFIGQHVPKSASGQVLSVAGRFALIGAAGELATRYGVTGWQVGDAEWSAGMCFRAWLDRRGGVGAREEETGVAQVRAFVEQNGSARFEIWENDRKGRDGAPVEQRIVNRAGFKRRDTSGMYEYFITPETWRNEVCKGHDSRMVAEALSRRGLLVEGSGGKHSRSLSVPGYGKMRLYHLRPSIIGDQDPASGPDDITPGSSDQTSS